MSDQIEVIDCLKYKMVEEGFDYCFCDYSDWKDLDDPYFHEFRVNYLAAKNALENYVVHLKGSDDLE